MDDPVRGGGAVTRVFLVDDHEIVRRGIAELVDAERDLEVVGEAGDVRQALARIPATRPDVAVLDVRLPDGNGIDLCREIRSREPGIACLILTAYDDDEAVRSAVLAGAAGYVIKDVRGQALLDAIRRVASGARLLPAGAGQRVVESATATATAAPAEAGLSLRERQVLEYIAAGLTNRQIAERLELAEKTVKNYVSGLLAKLGMESRTQAAVYRATGRRAEDQ
jgi:DNA-binding NarL/FixJ family response regulator